MILTLDYTHWKLLMGAVGFYVVGCYCGWYTKHAVQSQPEADNYYRAHLLIEELHPHTYDPLVHF